jgi:hypothetical protein
VAAALAELATADEPEGPWVVVEPGVRVIGVPEVGVPVVLEPDVPALVLDPDVLPVVLEPDVPLVVLEPDEPPAGVAHAEVVIVFVSRLTAPVCASSRPSRVAPVPAVIEVCAMTVPANVEFEPSVTEAPTSQKTLQA